MKILLFSFISFSLLFQSDFLKEQKRYDRVRLAIQEKESILAGNLKSLGLETNNFHLLMAAYKSEDELELFVKNNREITYQKIATYKICAKSGELGPKRARGDGQVPEGFYSIAHFNPTSTYYLSLGLNYPNRSDRVKSKAPDLGGDIFIHGSCVTIGCLPMTNDKIKEIYLYAVHARNNGQVNIPVYVFPFRMDEKNMKEYRERYKTKPELLTFWENLKEGYTKWENGRSDLKFSVDQKGDYHF